jgi:uncharacterized protein YkwD
MKRLLLVVMIAGCGGKDTPASDPAADPVADPDPDADPDPGAGRGRGRGRGTGTGREILDAHNAYRAKHCAPALEWDDKLEATAQDWADRCEFEHSRTKYGENLAAGTHGALPPEHVVEMWYREVDQYDFRRGGFSMETGHFTQLVWKGTTRVGCAMARCPDWDLWVCNYDPPGNVERGYRSNVLASGCK